MYTSKHVLKVERTRLSATATTLKLIRRVEHEQYSKVLLVAIIGIGELKIAEREIVRYTSVCHPRMQSSALNFLADL